MKIREILSQSRRDFYAIYECEHCAHITPKTSGYDDANFHTNVIPAMKCPSCDKTASTTYRALAPRYSESTII